MPVSRDDRFVVALHERPLLAGESLIQPAQDRLTQPWLFRRARVDVFADVAGNAYLDESQDGLTWNQAATVAVVAGVTAQIPWTDLIKGFYRVRYANGAAAQTRFRCLLERDGG